MNEVVLGDTGLGYDGQIIQRAEQNQDMRNMQSKWLRLQNESDNIKLIKLNLEKQMETDYENQKHEELRQRQFAEAQRRQEEIKLQTKLKACSHVEFQERQRKEKQLLKEKRLQQEKEEREMLFSLDEQFAQEQIHQAKKEAELKKRTLKVKIDDISRVQVNRDRQLYLDSKEERRAQRGKLEMLEEKPIRQSQCLENIRNRQKNQQYICDHLKEIKKKQGLILEAEVKQGKTEKKDPVVLPPISHTKNMLKETKDKCQSSADKALCFEEAYDKFLENSKLKAREEIVEVIKFNASLDAEKQALRQHHKRQERVALMTHVDRSAKRENMLQQLHQDSRKAAQEVNSQRQGALQEKLSYKKAPLLPAISFSTAKGATPEMSGLACTVTGCPPPRCHPISQIYFRHP